MANGEDFTKNLDRYVSQIRWHFHPQSIVRTISSGNWKSANLIRTRISGIGEGLPARRGVDAR